MRKLKHLFMLCLFGMISIAANAEDIPNNEIWYTSSDGSIIEPYVSNVFGATLLTNEYKNEKGVITFNGNVTSIGTSAFYGCSGLTSVTIPNSVTSIGSSAFDGCKGLASVIIPNSVIKIGEYAFYYCSGLKSVTIGNSVKSIGQDAFAGCAGLTSVTIPSSMIEMGQWAFAECPNVKELIYAEGIKTIFRTDLTSITSVTIPSSATSIENYAFYDCTELTNVTIPNSVTSIGSYAFKGCSGLTSVTIPKSVNSIGSYAFKGCYFQTNKFVNNSSLNAESNNYWDATICDTRTDDGLCIKDKSVIKYLGSGPSVTIPNSVTSIGSSAFSGCKGLASVTIPNSVTSIGNFAFSGCYFQSDKFMNNSSLDAESNNYWDATICDTRTDDGLCIKDNVVINYGGNSPSVIIPNSVTSIGSSAFGGCSGLTSVTIPYSVTSIGKFAFYDCSLTSVKIPSSVTEIGDWAFGHCLCLVSVYVEWIIEHPSVYSYSFPYYTIDLYVPAGTKDYYQSGYNYWSSCKKIIELPYIEFADAEVKSICVKNWDTNKDGELSYSEAEAVQDLGMVFYGNKLITSFDELQYFTGLTAIGERAFYNCSNLSSINLPNSVKEIDDYVFYDCINLSSIHLPKYLIRISESAFRNCSNLSSIQLPESVNSISEDAFSGCSGLTSIVVDKDNKTFDSRDYCNAIISTSTNTLVLGCKNTKIPNSVTSIGTHAFYGCTSLTTITIPESIKNIEEDAFSGCSGLSSITFQSLPVLEEDAFRSCDKISSIVLDLNDSDKPYIGTSRSNYPKSGNFTEVHYNRTLAADTWGTIVLPFVPDESSLAKVKLYALSDASSDAVRFKEVEADAVQAGVPYLFKNVSGQDDFTLTTSNTTISTNLVEQTPVNGMMLQGVYRQQKFTGDGTVYGISGNKFLTTTGTMTINPFHAYLKSVASGAKEILIDDEIDGIEDIKNLTPALSQGEGVNLQGIHVGKGYNGIVIINGKKYLNK